MFLLVVTAAAIAAFQSFTFRVQPDELGIVLRLGKFARQEPPGLHFRMPYPIEEVRLPKVTRQNVVEVRARPRSGDYASLSETRSLREDGLMITGDENIVAVDAIVFWHIAYAQDYLFNIHDPETTVNDVAESALREIVGRSDMRPVLTEARQATEQALRELMQRVLESYGAGIRVDQVRLQRVDPPAQVIDAFRDVQAARTDKERLQNEAAAYRDKVVPEARGEAERILQAATAYRERTIAESTGQAARLLQILEEYKKAPDVTRKRIYLETMEHLLDGTSKIILDRKGTGDAVPLPPSDMPNERRERRN
jgi:membrane protease subunit HflK